MLLSAVVFKNVKIIDEYLQDAMPELASSAIAFKLAPVGGRRANILTVCEFNDVKAFGLSFGLLDFDDWMNEFKDAVTDFLIAGEKSSLHYFLYYYDGCVLGLEQCKLLLNDLLAYRERFLISKKKEFILTYDMLISVFSCAGDDGAVIFGNY